MCDSMAVDSAVRRGAKRGARSDDLPPEEPSAARVAEMCEWCRQPGADRPSVVGIAAIRQDVYAHVSQMTLRHYACAYSSCVVCVQPTRTDLIAQFHGHFERQAQFAGVFGRLRFLPPCPEPN